MAGRIERNDTFPDWLLASAYVKGADQTARVVSKKKHRSKRNPGGLDSSNERLEAERQIRVFWKLSNRHYRRWMNDRLLRELAPPLDAKEIGSLFAPPPWGEKSIASPFERVCGGSAHDVAAWEPFRNNVDMDMEANVLHKKRHQGKLEMGSRRHNAAMVAWRGVSHRSRDVLRRSSSWHLVNFFEEKILDFLEEMERGGPKVCLLDADDAFHRMLIHGICEFHRLSSNTVSKVEDGEGQETRTVLIKANAKRKDIDCPQAMQASLMQFLTDANKSTIVTGPGS